MNFIPMLSPVQWLIMGLIPPAIIALYFLKLRRMPLEVPSTFLWRKAIEDLHVNSFWQRLRRNLLLFLQLLFVFLLLFVLLRPGWQSTMSVDSRMIFMIDASASMSSHDVKPTRLDIAKERALEMIDQMDSSSVGMVISFSDVAKVEKSFTGNKAQLREAVEAIKLTQHSTNALEALRQASGLANSETTFATDTETVDKDNQDFSEGIPASVYIFSDGRFPDVHNFSLGKLKARYIPIGDENANNVGITAFSVRPNPDKVDEMQAFANVENFTQKQIKAKLNLKRDNNWWDHQLFDLKPNSSQSIVFDIRGMEQGVLTAELDYTDDLNSDNSAYAIVQSPIPLEVLLVSEGNDKLEVALTRSLTSKLANVRTQRPDFLLKPEYQKSADSGVWDLIIFDRCTPQKMPHANTFYFGMLPPEGWKSFGTAAGPQITDAKLEHPLMRNLEFHDVLIASAETLQPPQGATRLLESTKGLLAAIAPREGFEDFVVSIPMLVQTANGDWAYNTDWHIRESFPLLIYNVLSYFSNTQDVAETVSVRPGSMVELRQEGAEVVTIKTPGKVLYDVKRSNRNTFPFSYTDEIGVYEVLFKGKSTQKFTVNLFDQLESNIPPIKDKGIQIGYSEVDAETSWQTGRYDLWKWLLFAAFLVVLVEWYIYNRRVYI